MEDIKVSVIVPVYNVAPFMARCATSLFEQTLREVEYIFVNDATPDKSMEALRSVMSRYPERQRRVSIVELEQNKGLPAARNIGLQKAAGEYIFHCDGDDFADPVMLEALYAAAKQQDADIVWCDWYLSLEKQERRMKQPGYRSPMEAVKGMLEGAMKFNVWNKLAKRSLYVNNQVEFPDGCGMGEDMTMIMLFAYARKVAYLPQAFYHYVKTNAAAFSRTYSERHLEELRCNVDRMERFVRERFGDALDAHVAYMKLEAKFPFLLSGDSSQLRRWREWYPEANAYIMRNRSISLRSRLLQWCAWKNQLWMVRAYAAFFNHVVYGLIYR